MSEATFSATLLSPALLLGILISLGHASLYHLWGGRTLRDLLVCCVVAGIGFAVGQFFGDLWSTDLVQIGQIHVLAASVGAWVALLGMHYLVKQP